MICAKFGWNWFSCSGEDFLISSMYLYGPSFEQTWIPFTQRFFVPNVVEIGSRLLEKKIFIFRPCTFAIIFSLLKRVWPFIWTNLNCLHSRMFCSKFGWNWHCGSGEEDNYILSKYFPCFVIISAWKRMWPFICRNLNPLRPRMLYAKFGWNWLYGSGEDENVKSLQTDKQMTGNKKSSLELSAQVS